MKFILDYRSPPSGYGQILDNNNQPVINLADPESGFDTSLPNLNIPRAFETQERFDLLVKVLRHYKVTEVIDSELFDYEKNEPIESPLPLNSWIKIVRTEIG